MVVKPTIVLSFSLAVPINGLNTYPFKKIHGFVTSCKISHLKSNKCDNQSLDGIIYVLYIAHNKRVSLSKSYGNL